MRELENTAVTGPYSVPVPWSAKFIPRLSWWDGKWRSLAFDVFVAVVAVSFGVLNAQHATPGYLALYLLTGMAFAVRRRWPWPAVLSGIVLAFANTMPIASMIAIYTMARRRGPAPSTWISVVLTAGTYVLVQLVGDGLSAPNTVGAGLVIVNGLRFVLFLAIAGVPALLGLWVHQRIALMNSLRDRAEAAERERALLAERAVTAERRRIAREMHDVVAHRVSVISLQAGALTVTAKDAATADTAEVIRKSSVDALTELRHMLNVLRDEGDSAASAEPGTVSLEQVDGLVEDAVAAGANVYLDRPAHLPAISGEASRAAYRVVQESLTNAGKHAPHAAVRVTLTSDGDRLRVSVVNRRATDERTTSVPGSGYGLIGMRERVTLVGGELQAGPAEDGGYRVEAAFPLDPNEKVV